MWDTVALGDVCKTSAGGTPLKARKEYYDGGTIPWLLSGEICKKEIFSAKNFITDEGIENSSAKIFPKDTTLIAMYGATAGQVSILRFPCATNQAVCGILPNLNYMPEFLYYFLSYYKDQLLLEVSGVAQPNLSQVKIKKISLPKIEVSLQRQIVAKLDAIFAEIDKATAAAEANAKNAEALFQSYLTQVFERGGEGWKNVYLHEVCDYEKNQGHYSGIPYIGLENIEARTTKLVSSQEQIEDVKSSTFKFTPEHLLYGRLRPYLNKVYLPTFEGHCSTEIFPIKPKNSLIREFLKYWFIQDKTVFNINSTCTGARMPRANMNAVLDFLFPLAPLATQRGIVDKLDALSIEVTESAKSYTNKVSELASLKQSILKQAFAGELVKD
jgi:type I restriction enzyme S subunit